MAVKIRTWMPGLDSKPEVILSRQADAQAALLQGSGDRGARGLKAAKDAFRFASADTTTCKPDSGWYNAADRQAAEERRKPPGCAVFAEQACASMPTAATQRGVIELLAANHKSLCLGPGILLATQDIPGVFDPKHLESLTTLSLPYTVFTGSKGLVALMKATPLLQCLSVHSNPLVFEDPAVSEAVSKSLLTHLDISRNDIPSAASAAILDGLKANRTITTLDLSDNPGLLAPEAEAADALKGFLSGNKYVTCLRLCDVGITPEVAAVVSQALSESLTTAEAPEHEPFAEAPDLLEDCPPRPAEDAAHEEAADDEAAPPQPDEAPPASDPDAEPTAGEGSADEQAEPPAQEGEPGDGGAAPEQDAGAEPEPLAPAPVPLTPEEEEEFAVALQAYKEKLQEEVEKKFPEIEEAPKAGDEEVEEDEEDEEKENEDPAEEPAADDGDAAETDGKEGEAAAGAGPLPPTAAEKREADMKAYADACEARFHVQYREQLSAVKAEAGERLLAEIAFFDERVAEKAGELAARDAARAEQAGRERRLAERETGWARVEELDLSNNSLSSAGAASLALLLRHEVPKTEDELAKEAEEREAAKAARAEELAAKLAAEEEARAAAEEAKAERDGDDDAPAKGTEESANAEEGDPTQEPGHEGEEEQQNGEEGQQDGDEEAPADDVVEPNKAGYRALRYLDVSQCQISAKGLKALAAVLESNNQSLTTLLLRRNKFGYRFAPPQPADEEDVDDSTPPVKVEVSGWSSPGIVALKSCLARNTTLTHLDVGGNQMGPVNCAALLAGVAENGALSHLGLSGNKLAGSRKEGKEPHVARALEMLCKVFELRGSATLEAVALRHNELDADCVEAIKPGLAMATSLRSLDLSRNYLGDAGASSLVDVLPQLTSLTSLNLAGNAIGETGLLMLAAGVETVRLEHLDLSENVITTPAAVKAVGRCFATPLKKARARSISCESAADTVRHLCTGLQEGLEDLDVSGNRLDKPAMTCLIRALPCAGKSLSRAVVWTRCSFSDEEWCEVLQEAIDTLPLCPLLASLVLSPPVSPAIAALDMKLQQLLAERRT